VSNNLTIDDLRFLHTRITTNRQWPIHVQFCQPNSVNIFVSLKPAMRLLLVLCLTLIVGVSQAQSAKKKKKPSSDPNRKSDTALEPYYPQNNYQPSRKSSKKKEAGPSFDSEREYYARLEQIEKTRRKNEKMLEKPQYSDPTYFGHKRPPKKRARGKMKFCKECGIRH
jgi:hypothetical protein